MKKIMILLVIYIVLLGLSVYSKAIKGDKIPHEILLTDILAQGLNKEDEKRIYLNKYPIPEHYNQRYDFAQFQIIDNNSTLIDLIGMYPIDTVDKGKIINIYIKNDVAYIYYLVPKTKSKAMMSSYFYRRVKINEVVSDVELIPLDSRWKFVFSSSEDRLIPKDKSKQSEKVKKPLIIEKANN